MKNYRIAEHPYYHAARCTADAMGKFVAASWNEFIKPTAIVACGLALGVPLAFMVGTALGVIWR